MIDEQVGRIMDRLEEVGLLENSVVIFTSDHGDCLGDHGLVEKWTMYDQSVRVPLVVWSPDRFEGNRRIDALTQWFDIGPTVLELAGVQPNAKTEAQSLLPFLENQPDKGAGICILRTRTRLNVAGLEALAHDSK